MLYARPQGVVRFEKRTTPLAAVTDYPDFKRLV